MIVNLNAFEIFEIAERIERNGAMFYRKAAHMFFDNENVRKILLEIAAMEDEHERTFAKMRRQLTSAKRSRFLPLRILLKRRDKLTHKCLHRRPDPHLLQVPERMPWRIV